MRIKIPKLADDDRDSIRHLALMRIPPLIIGLALGLFLSFALSRFEEVLSNHVEVAFFIPFVVYMAAAVGSQTQTIYARDVTRGTARFSTYFFKESALGIILGGIFGMIAWAVVHFWFDFHELATAVGLSIFAAVGVAPLIALLVTELLEFEHQDPAVGVGPIATVIQDAISIAIYGIIASTILLT